MAKLSEAQKVRNKWVKALNSGKYKQTQGYLRNDAGFCCLGVLCDLAVKAGVIKEPKRKVMYGDEYVYSGNEYCLPTKVKNWAGLKSTCGKYLDKGYETSLTDLNDDGARFKTIAKIIEKKPEGLFKEEK